MDRVRVLRDMSGTCRRTAQTDVVAERSMRGFSDAMRADVYEGWMVEWGLRPETWSVQCVSGSKEARGDPSMRECAREAAWDFWGFEGSRESHLWAYESLLPVYIDLEVER